MFTFKLNIDIICTEMSCRCSQMLLYTNEHPLLLYVMAISGEDAKHFLGGQFLTLENKLCSVLTVISRWECP